MKLNSVLFLFSSFLSIFLSQASQQIDKKIKDDSSEQLGDEYSVNKIQCLVKLNHYEYSLYMIDQEGGVKYEEKGAKISINFCNSLFTQDLCTDKGNNYQQFATYKKGEQCTVLRVEKYMFIDPENPDGGVQMILKGDDIEVDFSVACNEKDKVTEPVRAKNTANPNVFSLSTFSIFGCPTFDISYPWSFIEENKLTFIPLFIIYAFLMVNDLREGYQYVLVMQSIIIGIIITSNYIGNSWMSEVQVFRISAGVAIVIMVFVFSFKELAQFINGAFFGYLVCLILFNLTLNDKNTYNSIYIEGEVCLVVGCGLLNIFYQDFYSGVLFQMTFDLLSDEYNFANLFRGEHHIEKDSLKYLYFINTILATIAIQALKIFISKRW